MSHVTNNIEAIIAEIERTAKESTNEECIIDKMTLKDYYRQGDVYFQPIDKLPKGLVPWGSNQVTEGTSLGSTHTVHGCTVWKRPDHGEAQLVRAIVDGEEIAGTRYIGPIIEADSRWENRHAEHCRFENPPGYFQTYYQADPVTLKRVED